MEKELKFRTLRADEIECRIGKINAKGLALLLYKNARVDMTLLDEVVGPLNWKRRHCRDNQNCIVSIWDDAKKEWIEKEDVGVESFTEKEKGLASDSFKRACVNVGIGRELYTAPFIWIPSTKANIEWIPSTKANIETDTRGKYRCSDKFIVEGIHYDEQRNIDALSIINKTTNQRCFVVDNRKEKK